MKTGLIGLFISDNGQCLKQLGCNESTPVTDIQRITDMSTQGTWCLTLHFTCIVCKLRQATWSWDIPLSWPSIN